MKEEEKMKKKQRLSVVKKLITYFYPKDILVFSYLLYDSFVSFYQKGYEC